MNSALQTVALTNLLEENPQYALFMQINDGRSQLTHLLIDLGMKADRRRELKLPDDGWFLVVSRVLSRDPDAGATPDPFSLGR